MRVKYSSELDRKLDHLYKKNKRILYKLEKKMKLFQENPQHPSLRLHKLHGKQSEIWSISIDREYRVLFRQLDEAYVFFDIGTHDEVYE